MTANKQNENFGKAVLHGDRLEVALVPPVEASLRLPLLVLLSGAAMWLVLASVLAMIGVIKFHAPDFLADYAWLTYGRVQPAADNALLYGFCIPAGLAVILWLFAHLGKTPLCGAIVPLFAANLWHLGVFIGLIGILSGNSTGHPWLEFPRAASVLLFFGYVLLAMWLMMNFAARRERRLEPSHWFLAAALFWFPWIYSTANLFLIVWPVRGLVQAVIGWWFANNLLFVWLALVGIGVAFYFLPQFSGRPLQNRNLALYGFWTLLLFGTWCGIPPDAPVPAWLPVASSYAAMLTIVPVLAIAIVIFQNLRGGEKCAVKGAPFCFIRFGTVSFLLAALMRLAASCPRIATVTEFTWFGPAQIELQLYGFFALTMFGAIYYLLPRVAGFEWPFPRLARVQFWLSMLGVTCFVLPLAVGGVVQGLKLNQPDVGFLAATKAALGYLRFGTVGLLFILLGNLLFALNVLSLTLIWKWSLLKKFVALLKTPLKFSFVPLPRIQGDVKT